MTLKILSFTTLYPNKEQIRHGIFVENRLRHLKDNHDVEIRVCAPVPWFPFKSKLFGEYAKFSQVPRHETRHGIQIDHPRYLVIPKIGMNVAPLLMCLAMIPKIKRYIKQGYNFDVLDAHFFYPDGIAAVILGKIFNKPVTVTVRGNDISLYPDFWLPRKYIIWAARRASAIIAVCKALAEGVRELEIGHDRIHVMRNGVDLVKFRPLDRQAIRKELELDDFTLISVGHHIERKGHHLVIQALKELADTTLLIAGDGPMEAQLRRLAEDCGVAKRVRFLGALPQDDLAKYYSAADCMVLASSREGWANVLLESMACGTPVVATSIWGTPEVVTMPEAGILIQERSTTGLKSGIQELRKNYPDRVKTRLYAEQFSWDQTSEQQFALFSNLQKDKTPA